MSFADPIALLVAYLGPALAPVPVASRVADERPLEWLQVRRVGGPALPPVREAVRFDVFAWAETEERATIIGHQARSAVWALAGTDRLGVTVYTVGEFMGPTMTQDEETRSPQLWITFEVLIRAVDVMHIAT